MLQFQMDGDTSALSNGESWNKSGLEKNSSVFSLDDISAGTWHLCSSEAGSSLVWTHCPRWMKEEHLQQYPKILSGQDCFLVAGERGNGFLKREETLSAQLLEEPEGACCVLPKLLLGQTMGCGIGEQCPVPWRAWGNLCFSVKPCSKTA